VPVRLQLETREARDGVAVRVIRADELRSAGGELVLGLRDLLLGLRLVLRVGGGGAARSKDAGEGRGDTERHERREEERARHGVSSKGSGCCWVRRGSTVDYAGTNVGLTSARSIFAGAGFALVFAGLAAIAACRRSPPSPLPSTDRPLEVTFAGCAGVVVHDERVVCELGDSRALRVVVAQAATIHAIQGEAATPLPARVESAEHASIHHVDVPPGTERLVIRADVAGKPASHLLRIATARKIAWVDEAKALRAKGDRAGARALADAHVDAPDEVERTAATDLRARITLADGHADEAFPLFRTAIAAHRAANRISELIDDSFALAFALHQRSHRYEEARAALDAVGGQLHIYPEGGARAPYYRGILASETGDPRHALRLLREAETGATRLGMTRLARNARAARALELQVLGRFAESVSILEALEKDPEVKGCERVEVANDLGWGCLLANDASSDRARAPQDPRPMLRAALDDTTCSDAYLRSFALGNLARFALTQGNETEAAKHLADAQLAVKEPRGTERLAWLDLEARILLARHEPAKALARFDEARALARAAFLLDPEWSALIGRAEALQQLGRRPDAVVALLAAEEVLDRAILLVPLGEGRGTFVAERSRSARAAIELLLVLGRTDEAARLARRSRTRVLASVERASRIELLDPGDRARWEAALGTYRAAREAIDGEAANDWKLPADALARTTEARKEREQTLHASFEAAMAVLTRATRANGEPARDEPVAAGDLELVIHPGNKDWIVLASDAAKTSAHRVPDPRGTPAALASALFGPIATRLAVARRVRVRAYGPWLAVDVHALPFDGAPLLAKVAVDYPLGLRAASKAAAFERRALVVGDPDDTLVAARAEAMLVGKALDGRMPSALLIGPAATSRAVGAALARAGLFHYAGHAVQGSTEDWASHLRLVDGGRLTVADFLALAPAPRKAVLLGCDAARAFGEAEGVGLAQALIAAGTEEVLAPVKEVPDTLAKKLADALYAGAAADATLDLDANGSLAAAARLAILQVRAVDPDADWKVFRVLAR
jgi:tetratricopeptide (TPR) repeat protein